MRMGKQPPTGPTENTPLTEADIITALEGSGYPFELKLYRQFAKADMDPTLGQRFMMRDPSEPGDGLASREMDLLARWHRSAPMNGYSVGAITTLVMEAKKVHDPIRIIGILGPKPEDHQHAAWRARFHGCPSYGVLPGSERYSEVFLHRDGVASCLTPLLSGHFCAHWAAARRKKGTYQPFAAGETGDEDARLHDSLHTLAALTRRLEVEASQYLHGVGVDVNPLPSLGLYLPTLIIDTPTLYTYDVDNRVLAKTNWFTLAKSYDVHGQIVHRLIDVVCAGGVPELIQRTKAVGDQLFERMQVHGGKLRTLGVELRTKAPAMMGIAIKAPPRRI